MELLSEELSIHHESSRLFSIHQDDFSEISKSTEGEVSGDSGAAQVGDPTKESMSSLSIVTTNKEMADDQSVSNELEILVAGGGGAGVSDEKQDKTQEVQEEPPLQQQKSISAVKRILAMKWPRKKPKSPAEIDVTLHESALGDDEDESFITASTDELMVSADADSITSTDKLMIPESNLDTLVKEQEEESDEEVEELIKTILIGFENEDIQKELQEQTSSNSIGAEYDLQKEAEGFLATLVDKMDTYSACGCGRLCRNDYDDVSSQAVSSVRSVKKVDGNINIDYDDSMTLDTLFDDESLASEYDDFNKAMLLLKNRAAVHRLSEANLLEKVKSEQQRRQSIGLTPTMIEI